jgi:hypothetical protein
MMPVIASSVTVSLMSRSVVVTRWAGLELLILLFDVGNQVLTELLGLFNHAGIRSPTIR